MAIIEIEKIEEIISIRKSGILMDFRKIASGAATIFNRAVQATEERLGQADKTEIDAHVEVMLHRVDVTHKLTEKILKQVECILQKNPAYRMEGYVMETFDRPRPDRLTPMEELGLILIDAALDYSSESVYGNILMRCGQTQQKMGQEEKEYGNAVNKSFLSPLRSFLNNELKSLQRERKTLETRRLDLDVIRTRLRRAQTENAKQQQQQSYYLPVLEDSNVVQINEDVREAQRQFDRQMGIVRQLGESVLASHEHLKKLLLEFTEQQMMYFARCHQHLTELSRQLSSTAQLAAVDGTSTEIPSFQSSYPARALYDYQAGDESELSMRANESITVFCSSPEAAETEMWLMAERGDSRGKVPSAFVEILK